MGKLYLQITTFCNMKCAHCCYDSGPHRRDFMTPEVFEAALRWEPSSLLDIGGGEPTCHPLFWDFMATALRVRGKGRIWMATNGKLKYAAMILSEMVQLGEIKAVLSLDQWHEPISQDVMDAWKYLVNSNGKTAIRNVGLSGVKPIASGRCDWGLKVCNGMGGPFVRTDGTVTQCYCLDSPVIGNVFDGYKPINGEWNCWADRMGPDKRNRCVDAYER